MAAVATMLCVAMITTAVAAATPADDEALVRQYVQQFGNQTFREASGNMKYRYLVPGAALLPSVEHYLGRQFSFALTRTPGSRWVLPAALLRPLSTSSTNRADVRRGAAGGALAVEYGRSARCSRSWRRMRRKHLRCRTEYRRG